MQNSRPRSGGQQHRRSQRSGFTRTELCAVLAGLALLFAIILPALANTRSRAERLVCVSNLGEVGKGYNLWASEHGDYYPFMLPRADGGIRTHYNGLEVNSWFQFSWVSNELRSARVLACPSDIIKRPANDFSASAGGLLSPAYRNNAISYFLTYPFFPGGRRVLSGDRNIVPVQYGACSIFGPDGIATVVGRGSSGSTWEPTLHVNSGNLLFRDGAVAEVGNPGIWSEFMTFDDNSSVHILKP